MVHIKYLADFDEKAKINCGGTISLVSLHCYAMIRKYLRS